MITPLDEKAALRRAIQYTAIDSHTVSFLRRRVLSVAVSPWLPAGYAGRTAWELEFEPVTLRLPAAGAREAPVARLQVLLDALEGRLVRARYDLGHHDPALRPEPAGEEAEQQLRRAGEEYLGLPAEEPRLSLDEVLDRIYAGGIGNPLRASEISAHYLRHSHQGGGERRVWAVTLRGIPPLVPKGGRGHEVPVSQRNFVRNVVDDETGAILFATNIPRPAR